MRHVKQELAAMFGLAICGVLMWFAYTEKDAHTAMMLGYFAGLWGQVVIRVGGASE